MHPTLRPAVAALKRLLGELRPGRRKAGPARVRPRFAPGVGALEGRSLLSFSMNSLTAVPNTLWPPNGRYVPVVVSGTLQEFTVVGNKQVFKALNGPKAANFFVVDEYQRDEPSAPIRLTDLGQGKFSFSFTINLQASRATEYAAGRRYYITVAAKDVDGWTGKTIPVQVPISLTNRGQGPVLSHKDILKNKAEKMALLTNPPTTT